MTNYLVTLTDDELAIVRRTLPRAVTARRVADKPRKGPAGRPPKLSDSQRRDVARRWESAVDAPPRWHMELINRAAAENGARSRREILMAWGIETPRGVPA